MLFFCKDSGHAVPANRTAISKEVIDMEYPHLLIGPSSLPHIL
jgi:hypothetical protein